MIARLAAVLALGLGLAAGGVQAGKLYKWVDEKGVVHYGESIPPEYKDRASVEMNPRGVVIRRQEAYVPPEPKKGEEVKASQARGFAQQRRDAALLATYTSEQEIDEARDRNLTVPLQAIKGLEPRVNRVQAQVGALRRQADGFAQAGKPVPLGLKEEIDEQTREVAAMQTELNQLQDSVAAIRARFEADRKRYLELKQAAAQ